MNQTLNIEFYKYIFSVLVPILVALVSLFVGIIIYYKQKEYELVRERYLENTIDLICSGLDHALSIFRTNYHICFGNLKTLKGLGEKCNLEFLSFEYKSYEINPLSIVASYRLNDLLDTDLFWKLGQLTTVFVDNFNNYFCLFTKIIFNDYISLGTLSWFYKSKS